MLGCVVILKRSKTRERGLALAEIVITLVRRFCGGGGGTDLVVISEPVPALHTLLAAASEGRRQCRQLAELACLFSVTKTTFLVGECFVAAELTVRGARKPGSTPGPTSPKRLPEMSAKKTSHQISIDYLGRYSEIAEVAQGGAAR